ncbi:MAG: hypothetical protein ACYS8Z_13065 [Planctomycetota bacterium]
MNLRNLWKAKQLEGSRDILPRFVFRLVWCTIGGCVFYQLWTSIVKTDEMRPSPMAIGLLAIITVLVIGGVVVDWLRLKMRDREAKDI